MQAKARSMGCEIRVLEQDIKSRQITLDRLTAELDGLDRSIVFLSNYNGEPDKKQ
jgi:hypothetical protein